MLTTLDLCKAGEEALDAECWADAGRLFAEAVEREPSCVNAWSGLASALEKQRLYAEARAAYERVLTFEERQPVLTLLGAVQHHLHDDPAALVTLRRSLELWGDDDEAHYHLGLALRSSDLHASLHHLQESERLDPTVANTTREIGVTLLWMKRFDEARAVLDRAVASAPADPWAHSWRGNALEYCEQFADAKAAYLRAADLLPDCGLFLASAARMDSRLGRDADAETLFRRAIASEMDSAIACREYGLFLRRRGRLTSARRYLQRAVDLDPDERRARQALEELG